MDRHRAKTGTVRGFSLCLQARSFFIYGNLLNGAGVCWKTNAAVTADNLSESGLELGMEAWAIGGTHSVQVLHLVDKSCRRTQQRALLGTVRLQRGKSL